MLHYWYLVYARAFWDSIHFVDKSGEGVFFDLLVLGLTAIRLWTKNKGQPMKWLPRLKGLIEDGTVIALIAFILVFLGKLAWTPYGMQSETETQRYSALLQKDGITQQLNNLNSLDKEKDHKLDRTSQQLSTTFTQLAQSQ
jgi:hypothetical protein